MNAYVVGFIFSVDYSRVVLISKNRPAWQKGKLNGIGGAIHEVETPAAAMVREAMEEAGLATQEADWRHFLRMRRPAVAVDFFVHVLRSEASVVRTTTDEEVAWYDAQTLPAHTLSNIRWMVPLALDALTDPKFSFAEVLYRENPA